MRRLKPPEIGRWDVRRQGDRFLPMIEVKGATLRFEPMGNYNEAKELARVTLRSVRLAHDGMRLT